MNESFPSPPPPSPLSLNRMDPDDILVALQHTRDVTIVECAMFLTTQYPEAAKALEQLRHYKAFYQDTDSIATNLPLSSSPLTMPGNFQLAIVVGAIPQTPSLAIALSLGPAVPPHLLTRVIKHLLTLSFPLVPGASPAGDPKPNPLDPDSDILGLGKVAEE